MTDFNIEIPTGASDIHISYKLPTPASIPATPPSSPAVLPPTSSPVVLPPSVVAAKAFPGAEGFGTQTRGAFGTATLPEIYHVTNLNDSGAGSFRNAFATDRPVFVVFDVAGYISLSSDVVIANPYVTVAAQTSPGGGVCLKGRALRIKTHDVIIRGLKVRNGTPGSSGGNENQDGIAIENQSAAPYNIIIDHCTMSWGSDETAVSWYACHDITWSYNMIYEGWNGAGHGYGLLAGDRSTKISIHHNLFALNKMRNPECNDGSSGEIVNNVVYGWGNRGIDFTGTRDTSGGFYAFEPCFWNVIGNYLKRGSGRGTAFGIQVWLEDGNGWGYYVPSTSRIFLKDNMDLLKNPTADNSKQWAGVEFVAGKADTNLVRSASYALAPSDLIPQNAQAAYNTVLAEAGAPVRDSRDLYVIDCVKNGTGSLITSTPSFPAIIAGTRRVFPDSPLDRDAVTGYYAIETFANSLI